jgi:hypothetical protein
VGSGGTDRRKNNLATKEIFCTTGRTLAPSSHRSPWWELVELITEKVNLATKEFSAPPPGHWIEWGHL